MQEVIQNIDKLIDPIVKEFKISNHLIEIVNESNQKFLKITVDSTVNKVDFDYCSKISYQISNILDNSDLIKDNYILEICGPSIEKELITEDDYKSAIMKLINIEFITTYLEKKHLVGRLTDYDIDNLTIEIKEKTRLKSILIERDKIKKVLLSIEF